MTRFETPGQVVLLFAGAAIISVVLVALLNVEAKNRKLKEPEIENGNLFQVFGKKIMTWARRLRQHNTTHPDSGVNMSRLKRGLKSIRDEDRDNKVEHPVRHHGKHRRKLEPVNPPHNVTSSPLEERNNQTDGPLSKRIEDHQLCYNTNQVLLIIAVTCAVNFAFIFIIMTLVHVCNRSANKLSGLDPLGLTENGDSDSQEQKLRRENSSYSSVQEYVNSLPSSFERTASMLSLHSIHRSHENLLRKTFSMEDLLFVG